MSWGGERVSLIRELLWQPGMPCWLCGRPILTRRDMHVDHRLPRALGGTDALANLAPAHVRCNLAKGAGLAVPAPPPSAIATPIQPGEHEQRGGAAEDSDGAIARHADA